MNIADHFSIKEGNQWIIANFIFILSVFYKRSVHRDKEIKRLQNNKILISLRVLASE